MADSQGPTVTAVAIVFAVISFFAVLLRAWARIFLVKSVGPDDYLMVVAVLLAWAFIGCTIASVQHGLGDHIADVQLRGIPNMITYSQIVWLSSIFYNACVGTVKLSVLALYRRLGDKTLSRLALIMTGVMCAQVAGNVLAATLQCSPVKAAYDITIPETEKKCININAFYLANAAVNIATDLMTYSLPIPLIIKLQVPRRTKISLGIILGLGLFACVSSIIRITYIPPMLFSDDPTYVISGAMYWSVIESNVGILAASIPSYKIIAKMYAPKLLGSSYEVSGKQSDIRMGRGGYQPSGSLNGSKHGGSSMARELPDDTSEEELVPPQRRIGVKTEIVHRYESGNPQPLHNAGVPV